MARHTSKLTVMAVNKFKEPGLYNDGWGLYLKIGKSGGKSWVFRYKMNGEPHAMGLGPIALVTLQEAREFTLAHRKSLHRGEDPLQIRRQKKIQKSLADEGTRTFDHCFDTYYRSKKLKNPKDHEQWQSTREKLKPIIGGLPVHEINVALVLKAVEPMWNVTPQAADKVRNKIEQVLDYAFAKELRKDANPARWKGCLDKILPPPLKVKSRKHFASLPYKEIGAFMEKLRQTHGLSARALELTILVATRTTETRAAKWGEFNLEDRLWVVPAERMGKTGKKHLIPLSSGAIRLLQDLPRLEGSDYLFPSRGKAGYLSNMAMLEAIKDLGYKGKATTHGFRSTFRTWVQDKNKDHDFSDIADVAELSLSHSIGNSTQSSYKHGLLLEQRKLLMEQWAQFCDTPEKTADVVDIRARKA